MNTTKVKKHRRRGSPKPKEKISYEANHKQISRITEQKFLVGNGLRIEFLNEYDRLFYDGHAGMITDKNGWWEFEKYPGMIPLSFSILARKEL